MSPHVVMPGVFWHASPFLPAPLGRQANVPEVSFAEHVCPAGHENGLEAHPDDFESSDEQATNANAPANERRRTEPMARMMEGT